MNNVGGIDRIARVIVGVLLILATTLGFIGVWGWIGVVPLATGLLRTCPLYKLFGFSSCPIKKAE
ncbi:MAG: YgaP family membrane protein [Deefgea sp.]